LLSSLSAIGVPSSSDESESVALSGVTLAVEALSQLSDAQLQGDRKEMSNRKEDGEAKRRNSFTRVPKCWESPSASSATDVEKRVVENCGSVVIFTSYSDDTLVSELEGEVADMVNSRNRIIKSLQDNSFSCIRHVNLYIINIFPVDQPSNVTPRSLREISPNVSSCVFSRPAGVDLISAIHCVAMGIYDLVSTTVSGIPMKVC
ncbi:unnamed protein product, partial [Heligmosomoides polygyrus]|uniref:Protein asunder n=1 Tax=Heligmosomoides polygyrus TaxID=6339 RepID=A0A183GTQ7_HELPZ